MSFEGYYQHICTNGHYFVSECSYAFMEEDEICSCGAKSAWTNIVDETNCEGVGYIPPELLKGSQYNKLAIPSDSETRAMRTYRHHSKGLVYYSDENYDDLRKVVFPEYLLCEYEAEQCSILYLNLSEFRCREPQDNVCS